MTNIVKSLSLKFATLSLIALSSGCAYLRIDPDHFMIRSDVITSPEQEREILSKAKLDWTPDKKVRVLYVRGTPYERGYQHGVLLRQEVRDNLMSMYEKLLDKFRFEELLDESYERQRAFIPQEYIDEMHGLAHGSRLPLRVIHAIHALPEITEWGGKKRLKKVIKDMMEGVYGTSCSNFSASGSATPDKAMYTVRILDWGLHKISKLHEYPLITVNVPEGRGIPSANVGWIGFLGAVSGMNSQGITLGEMGYGDPEGETMRGTPMPFVLRDVLSYASNLAEVRHQISSKPGTNSFVFLMSDGKNGRSELYVRDRNRFEIHKPGVDLRDEKKVFPGIKEVLYGGHYEDRMQKILSERRGEITPELIMKEIIPFIAMPSNFQNVVYEPRGLQMWFNNARSPKARAAEEPYTYFNLAEGLKAFLATSCG